MGCGSGRSSSMDLPFVDPSLRAILARIRSAGGQRERSRRECTGSERTSRLPSLRARATLGGSSPTRQDGASARRRRSKDGSLAGRLLGGGRDRIGSPGGPGGKEGAMAQANPLRYEVVEGWEQLPPVTSTATWRESPSTRRTASTCSAGASIPSSCTTATAASCARGARATSPTGLTASRSVPTTWSTAPTTAITPCGSSRRTASC